MFTVQNVHVQYLTMLSCLSQDCTVYDMEEKILEVVSISLFSLQYEFPETLREGQCGLESFTWRLGDMLSAPTLGLK